MTILETKIKEYLTTFLGRTPTDLEIAQNLSNPLIVSKIHNTLNVVGSEISIGPTESIQDNLDLLEENGGGTLKLNIGTYLLQSDIFIPSGVRLSGATPETVIIDCNGDYSVKIIGSDSYGTGTISVNDGSQTVTGSGTSWNSSMVGQTIFLANLYFTIEAVSSATQLTIDFPYSGDNLSGAYYKIATPISNSIIDNITITNSNIVGLFNQYSINCSTDNITITSCAIGVKNYDSYAFFMGGLGFTVSDCGRGLDFIHAYSFSLLNPIVENITSDYGVYMEYSGDSTLFNFGFYSCASDNIYMKDCSDITMLSFTIINSGRHGIHFLSGCNDIQLLGGLSSFNTGDGIKLSGTSNRNVFNSLSISNNGAYGINIASVDCGNNQIISPAFESNVSGNINNANTTTKILPETPTSGSTTYNLATASGTMTIAHGLKQLPKKVIIKGLFNDATINSQSDGAFSSSGNACIFSLSVDGSSTTNVGNSTTYSINVGTSGTTYQTGIITVDLTNITITWTKVGSPTGTAYIFWQAE